MFRSVVFVQFTFDPYSVKISTTVPSTISFTVLIIILPKNEFCGGDGFFGKKKIGGKFGLKMA